ncbi:FAD-dependent monooxygenase [Pseudonocardia nematodicida]|uniref:FAD-dependent monooxygenase n=1 Tax=Pseudonocardia nematodicida TaxID=1206997 RepID=A0ABV1K7D3_9PSEU
MWKSPCSADFVVIGGGIGGLAAALQIVRRGVGNVVVLERAPEFGEVGAGLQLAPNASRVLDELGVLDAVSGTAFRPERLVLRDIVEGDEITALRTGEGFTDRYGYPYLVAHRVDVHRALLEACAAEDGVTLVPGVTVSEVTQDADGVVVHCDGGARYSGSAAIGADGIASTVRQQLIEDGPPVATGYVAYRGTVPAEDVKASTGGSELTDMVIWIGPGIHLVQYPVRGGRLCNQVAVFRSDVFTADPGAGEWGTPAEFEERFRCATWQVRRSIELMDTSRRWEMYDRPPTPGWASGRIALLGDAAHPMLQYLAQGACQALEDSRALGSSLAGAADIGPALKDYERQRYPRAAVVQTKARAFGEILHADGALAAMRNYFLRRRSDTDYEPVDWLYVPDG